MTTGPQAAARARVRAFLAENLTVEGGTPPDWFSRLARSGYVVPHWPEPWGVGAGPAEQLAIDAELHAAGVPRPENPIALGWAGPTILAAGSDEQQHRFFPGMLDGSEVWCQLFSEPEAGSDLSSLTTSAVRDGDEWVVDGQKIWSSLAHRARYGILLARTDPDAPKRAGISYFVVDMASPGIEVRPIRQMNGASDFNEVFLDRVWVPAENLVGAPGDGWRLTRVTLANERVALSSEGALWGSGPTAAGLLAAVKAGGVPPTPTQRHRLAALHIEAEVLRALRLRTVSAQIAGQPPGPEGSVRKAIADRHGQRLFGLAVELCGPFGMLNTTNPDRLPGPFPWPAGFLFSPALTIGGGTAEVQRNIIAERVLGLPRDAS